MHTRLALIAALTGGLFGCKSFAYQCAASTECTQSGAAGTCEPSGFCSFPDGTCASGRRYGEWAGSLAETCAGDEPGIDAPGPDAPVVVDAPAIDAPPNAITVSFGETGTATFSNVTIDAELVLGSPDNGGAYDHSAVDQSTGELALYRFDVSMIPSGATVVSARIEVSTIGDGQFYTSGSAALYQVLQTWDELTMTSMLRNATEGWTNLNAGPPSSRNPTPLGTFSPLAEGRYPISLPAAMVQSWVSSPATNAGVLFETTDGVGHLHLGCKEGEPAEAALLFVTYLPP